MAYSITFKDGSPLLLIADNTVDTSRSVTFVGKDYRGYGIYQNQNLITLLTNSASPNHSKPINPLVGELWYDVTNQKLNIWDPAYNSNGGWKNTAGAVISRSQPGSVAVGDFWYDVTNKTLNLYTFDDYLTITTYPRLTPSGWIVPNDPVLDNTAPTGVTQQVTLLKNNGNVVGALSNSSFIASTNDSSYTFPLANSAAYSILQGLNIIGYVQATGGLVVNTVNDNFAANSTGVPGQLAASTNSLFVCVANNSWKKIQLTSY